MDETLEVKGKGARLTVTPTKVIIKHTGSLKGAKEIRINQISAIQLKKAGIASGHIEISFVGGESTATNFFGTPNDENSVYFSRKQQPDFERAKELIEQYRDRPQSGAAVSGMDELAKLAELRDKGIVSTAEFEAKKKQILGL